MMELGCKQFEGPPSLEELLSFYSLSSCEPPSARPYIWINMVRSFDNVIHFGKEDDDGAGPSNISLKKFDSLGSAADWRLLNTGWALADAVLTTGENLREEGSIYYSPRFSDLIDHRNSLKKPAPYDSHPLQLVLTRSGNLNFSHPTFTTPGLFSLILTTPEGKLNCLQKIEEHEQANRLGAAGEVVRISPEFLITSGEHGGVDFEEILRQLKNDFGIKYIEVDGGGTLFTQLLQHQLIDEIKTTITGIITGSVDSKGNPRPSAFPFPFPFSPPSSLSPFLSYGLESAPLLRFLGLRFVSDRMFFLRAKVDYRSGAGSLRDDSD